MSWNKKSKEEKRAWHRKRAFELAEEALERKGKSFRLIEKRESFGISRRPWAPGAQLEEGERIIEEPYSRKLEPQELEELEREGWELIASCQGSEPAGLFPLGKGRELYISRKGEGAEGRGL